jgi:hypothetical protein
MFNFFRRKEKKKENPITDVELQFFKKLVEILPQKYHYLYPQINDDFLIGFKENELGYKNSYTFLLNANIEPSFKNKKLPHFFILQNIKIWNNNKNDFVSINLNILSGYLGGFNIESIDFSSFDFTKFDISELYEKHFENKDLEKIVNNFSEEDKTVIKENIGATYEIELNEGKFYFFDNLNDGNVIALDANANVFLLFHDPYKIEKIFSKEELLEKLKNNTFKEDIIKVANL